MSDNAVTYAMEWAKKTDQTRYYYAHVLADEIKRLRAELDEYENAKKFVLDPPHDEIHCGCVQLLNHELIRIRDTARGYIRAHKLMRVRFQDATDAQIYEEAEDMLTEHIAALDRLATPASHEGDGGE